MSFSPDQLVIQDIEAENAWSDLSQFADIPKIDRERMLSYRMQRIKQEMQKQDVALCVMVNPVSQRYAVDYRNYALFSAHIPCTYLFVSVDAPWVLFNALAHNVPASRKRQGRAIGHFYAGNKLVVEAEAFAQDVFDYLTEIGSDSKRVALEYVNPSITQALERKGIEVIDGALISENARLIKSEDELNCIRWAMAVAELGAAKIKQALRPGVSELQLWALLNYTNQANDGDWHEGRMLCSGPRTNPWLQEVSSRKLCSGDLLGFDTDMVGPMGYFADLSRTFHCGPRLPTRRQKQLYRLAVEEIDYNLKLIKPGVSFIELQNDAWPIPEEFQQNAYTCVLHGVGMCDEYPHIHPSFRGAFTGQGELQAGMVVCLESYIGAVGEIDGVKLEQQVVVTEDGYQLISNYPYEETLL